MVYVTGDVHADIKELKKRGKGLKKGDYLIVCGDFGFLWEDNPKELKILKKIGKNKYNILFFEGRNDNILKIREYEQQDYLGGKARNISGNLTYLERGYVFNIEGKNIFVFGGGETQDMDVLEEGVHWWREELPTQDEIQIGWDNLSKLNNKVDYVLTHQPSGRIRDFIRLGTDTNEYNNLHHFFNEICNKCKYTKWIYAQDHMDKKVTVNTTVIFKKVIQLK